MSNFIPKILESIELPSADVDLELAWERKNNVLPIARSWAADILQRQYGPDIAKAVDRPVIPEVPPQDIGAEVIALADIRDRQATSLLEDARRQVREVA